MTTDKNIVLNPTSKQIKEKIVRIYCETNKIPYDERLEADAYFLEIPANYIQILKAWAAGKIGLFVE